MIEFKVPPGARVLELGGGDNPQSISTVNVDVRPGPKVHFTVDFNKEEPWPIQSLEWDAVVSVFALEHISWRVIPFFLQECYRVLKAGGNICLVTPNTEAQFRFIQERGWLQMNRTPDNDFVEASRMLFGDLDYPENSHRAYLSPTILTGLLQAAGFTNINIQPYGEVATDQVVVAVKPAIPEASLNLVGGIPVQAPGKPVGASEGVQQGEAPLPVTQSLPAPVLVKEQLLLSASEIFDRNYFDGGKLGGGYAMGGYRDFPCHETTYRLIRNRWNPASVLELGCARGYLVKRFLSAGIPAAGIDVSKHCWLTRACNEVVLHDVTRVPWPVLSPCDFCVSVAFFEHIPEKDVPVVMAEMARYSQRGIHGIDFGDYPDRTDLTKVTLKPKEWWQERMPPGHIAVDKNELEPPVPLPEEYLKGDGKLKLNLGCATTMFHQGWLNVDILDLKGFSEPYGYQFQQLDLRGGFPWTTGMVDLIWSSHSLEHLTYAEGRQFLAECRRVLNPQTGALRVVVPDAEMLMRLYTDAPYDSGVGIWNLADFDQLNVGCAESPTAAGKLYSLLHANHSSIYDEETLRKVLEEVGFQAQACPFRNNGFIHPGLEQIQRETTDSCPSLSLFVDALPAR